MAKKKEYSFWEQTAIGGISGVCEVTCTQPTVAVKNALQEARPIKFTPRFMYTGLAVSVFSFFPFEVERKTEREKHRHLFFL